MRKFALATVRKALIAAGLALGAASPTAAQQPIPNETCLGCHGNPDFAVPDDSGAMRSLSISADRFSHSVHGDRQCVECHTNITEVPHPKVEVRVSCVQCHERLWREGQGSQTPRQERLATVVAQIDAYMKSVHARPNAQDQTRTNAACIDCHEAHYVFPPGSPLRAEWRLGLPNTCGKCHAQELAAYATSVHGVEVMQNHNARAAICSDCHTTHSIEDPSLDTTRLVITRNCGSCHDANYRSYIHTYHGQVTALGFGYTAKCFDCHGGHTIQRVSNPASAVSPANRLETCRKCHANATAGFATFEPHATTDDFARYPWTWLASKFMTLLLLGTFAFFWTHTALWFYREYRERQRSAVRTHVVASAVPHAGERHFERFTAPWRAAHLGFAVSLMILTLTGMTIFYANTSWARYVISLFGTPERSAVVHRIFAVVFLAIFVGQLVYFVVHIARNLDRFEWFGPNSLIPNLQDLKDIVAMFKWFFALGPRPSFDRWTYWEKFDYWAPFWGVTIIGASGFMLWFKGLTATYLPGWVFNVAAIFHGEEAFLAAVFLFTVHFFNNHFRPDKFPLDIVMFTGAVPIEEFRREHAKEYDRLRRTGELQQYLVEAPSHPMTLGSKILGFTLITVGLVLLVLVLTGFIQSF